VEAEICCGCEVARRRGGREEYMDSPPSDIIEELRARLAEEGEAPGSCGVVPPRCFCWR
jgi:hypothetical protein